MIDLFHIPNYTIDTSKFNHYLHANTVINFEKNFCDYVGAKYACSINSATNAIFLALLNKNKIISVPSMIPPVVCNAILTSGNKLNFYDDVNWVGDSYVLHKFCELLEYDYLLPHFPLLKSREKLLQQDRIWKLICLELKWEFIKSI